MRGPEAQARFRQTTSTRCADCQRDTEVRNDGFAFKQQDVGRLDVAVDHALAVGVVERLGHIGRDVDSVGNRELMLAVEAVLQSVAFHVGHHVEKETVGLAVVLISARKRSAPTTAANSGFKTFSATFRSCLRSSAR